jgi:hypothetical protein
MKANIQNKTKKSKKTNAFIKHRTLQCFLKKKYVFIYDFVSNQILIKCKKKKNAAFKQLHLLSLLSEVRDANLPFYISKEYISDTIGSFHFSKRVNRLDDFFKSLSPSSAGQCPFEQLAGFVVLENESVEERKRLILALKRWFVSAVRIIMRGSKRVCVPKQMLVFQGPTGIGKTPFFMSFLPPELDVYATPLRSIAAANKDCDLALASKALIIFDEIDEFLKNTPNRNAFKAFTTQSMVNVRPPFGRVDELRYRIASFLGTCNNSSFLSDPTGTQRFVVFSVKKLWNRKKISEAGPDELPPKVAAQDFDVKVCWAKALDLYNKGWDPEYSTAELERNEEFNERYKYNSVEFERVVELIEPSGKGEGEFMTSTQILNYVQERSSEFEKFSISQIGKSLIRLGFSRVSVKTRGSARWGYWVKKIQPKIDLPSPLGGWVEPKKTKKAKQKDLQF